MRAIDAETHEKRTETHGVCLDTISRKAAVDALSYCQTYLFDSRDDDKKISLEDAEYAIEQLPSARPDNRLEKIAELMEGSIDHFDLNDAMDLLYQIKDVLKLPSAQPDIDEWCDTCREYDSERHCCPRYNRVIREAVEEVKKERKTGRWSIKDGELAFWDVCSECKKMVMHKAPFYNYCPHCGAKMEGAKE